MNTKVLTLLVLCLGIFSLSGCIRTPEWTLFYYADQAKSRLIRYKRIILRVIMTRLSSVS